MRWVLPGPGGPEGPGGVRPDLRLRNMGTHSSYGFDICNSTYCQVYRGMGNGSASYSPSQTSMRRWPRRRGSWSPTTASWPKPLILPASAEPARRLLCVGLRHHQHLSLSGGVEDPYETYDSSWTVSYTASELEKRFRAMATAPAPPGLPGAGVFQAGQCDRRHHPLEKRPDQLHLPQRKQSHPLRVQCQLHPLYRQRETVRARKEPRPAAAAHEHLRLRPQCQRKPVDSLDDMYVISGSGTISPIEKNPYVISGSGTVSALDDLNLGGSTGGGGPPAEATRAAAPSPFPAPAMSLRERATATRSA